MNSQRTISDCLETVPPSFLNKNVLERMKSFLCKLLCQHENTIDTVALLATKHKVEVIGLMVLLGPFSI